MIGKALLKGIWILRWTAIIAALVYVGLNLVRTLEKALEGQVVVSLMEKDLPEYLFPSITICSKYKDGNSDVLPILWLYAWNNSGEYVEHVLLILIIIPIYYKHKWKIISM